MFKTGHLVNLCGSPKLNYTDECVIIVSENNSSAETTCVLFSAKNIVITMMIC